MKKFVLAALAVSVSAPALAAPVIYTSKSAFQAATSTSLYTFPDSATGSTVTPRTVGPVTFAADEIEQYNDGFYGATTYLGTAGDLSVTATTTALGLDLGSFFGAGRYSYTVNGVSGVISLPDPSAYAFIGFLDTSPISVTFANPNDEIDVIDFYAGNSAPAVPEPAAWALMIVGFGLTGAAMRRQKVSVRFA